MNDELTDLETQLQAERQQIVESLTAIDNKLSSINTVLDLLKEQHIQPDKKQIPLFNGKQISNRFSGLPFKKSVILLLKDEPKKTWTPKDIFEGLLKEGFKSNSKNFKNTARTMLMHMRKKGEVKSIKAERSFLYSYKEKEINSAPHTAEAEFIDDVGGLGERSKPADL